MMIIGIPKEILPEERRVAATPETVRRYKQLGYEVIVQTGAGAGIFESDEAYEKAGAQISPSAEDVFARADIVLKVKQPYYNEGLHKHEAELLRAGATLITFLHPAAPGNHAMVKMLRDRNVTAFTMDGIPRISRAQRMDALTSMSTITGYKAVLMAADHLPKFIPMIGTAIGTVKPASLLIIGAGVVGLQAMATAKRLGGQLRAVDIREDARREAATLGAKIAGFDVPPAVALGKGGYAQALSADWLEQERALLAPLLPDVDVIILSALVPGECAPVLITDEMVARMKPGSAIVDVSIDQGGNCAATVPGQEVTKHGVYICGVQNIPGRLPLHASWLYATNLCNYVENLYKGGRGQPDFNDEIVAASLVTRDGKIVHTGALKAMRTE
jgi:H+-translocating NAD(P) transhydrogenase subunit alpha